MKSLVIALCLIGLSVANSDKNFDGPCPSLNPFSETKADICCRESNCGADATSKIVNDMGVEKYDDFIKYTNEYFVRSFEYFFLSAQFGTYAKDRPGFQKTLKGLSDGAWNKGIEMIKEMAKRGFYHHFDMNKDIESISSNSNVTELVALAKAAEIEKGLLIKANDIHRHHSHAAFDTSKSCGYDAGLSHYIAEEILEEKTSTVRTLVGHVNQLKKLFAQDPKTYGLSVYMFDEHLQ